MHKVKLVLKAAIAVIVMSLCCGLSSSEEAPGKKMVKIDADYEVNKILAIKKISKPVIDGKVAVEEWKSATFIPQFLRNYDGKPVMQKTEAYMGYDADNLYFAFIFHENKMDKINAAITQRDDQIWKDDCLEMFLSPKQDSTYYHIGLNPVGTQYDADMYDVIRNLKWSSAVQKEQSDWTAEIAIPFKELGVNEPPDGQSWKFNLYRSEKPNKETSAFNPTLKGFHNPERFATMVFGGSQDELLQKQMQAIKAHFQQQVESLRSNSLYCAEKTSRLENKDLAARAETELKAVNADIGILEEKISKLTAPNECAGFSDIIKKIDRDINKFAHIGESYYIWQKNPMLAIGPAELPPADKPELQKLEMFACMNETEPVSFVVTSFREQPVTLRITPRRLFRQGSTNMFIAPESIELREGVFMGPMAFSNDIIADAFPLLNESRTVTVPQGQSKELWLSVNTKGIPPGIYTGNLYLSDTLSMFARRLQLVVEIAPVRLPDKTPCLINLFPQWGMGSWSIFRRDKLENYVADMAAHRCNAAWWPDWLFPYPVVGENGKVIEPLDHRVLGCYDEMLGLFKKHGIKPILRWDSWNWEEPGRYARLADLEPFETEWNRVAAIWLKALVAHLREKGFGYEDFYLFTIDEPNEQMMPRLVKLHSFVRSVDPQIRIFQSCGGNTTFEHVKKIVELKLADVFCCYGPYGASLLFNEQAMDIMKKAGPVTCYYNTISNKHASPLNIVRKQAWSFRRYKTDGGGFWGYGEVYFPNETWFPEYKDFTDQYSWWVKNEHGGATYNDMFWKTGPVPSRRWEIFRDGVEDYIYLNLLEESVKRAKKQGLKTNEAEALVKEFDQKLYDDKDPDAIYGFRRRLAAELLRLNSSFLPERRAPDVKIRKNTATLKWSAQKPLMAIIYYRQEPPQPEDRYYGSMNAWKECPFVSTWEWKKTDKPAADMIIKLDNLEAGLYSFCYALVDELGSVTFDDNEGKNYQFEVTQ